MWWTPWKNCPLFLGYKWAILWYTAVFAHLQSAKWSYYSSPNTLTTISPFTDARSLLGPRNSTWIHTHSAISICGIHDSDHANLPNAIPFSLLGLMDYWCVTLATYLKKPTLWNLVFLFLEWTSCWFKSTLCIANWGFTLVTTESSPLHEELQPSCDRVPLSDPALTAPTYICV